MQNYTADSTFKDDEYIIVHKEKADRDKNIHTHEFIEIIFTYSGKGVQIIDGEEHIVKKGDMLFVNFGKSHAFSMSDMEFIHILLRPEFMSERLVNSENIFDVFALPQFSSIEGEFGKADLVSFSGNELNTVTELIDMMLREYTEKPPAYQTVLSGSMEIIFTLLIRKLKQNSIDNKTDMTSKIMEYVSSHLFEKITLSDIAAHCFYNPAYFSRKFKQYFGKNLSDYIRERRLFEAARMLGETTLPITYIYTACCFSDKSQFYRLFKAQFGCTPTEYRKK